MHETTEPTPREVDLSPAEMAALERYAVARGLTTHEAATQLAAESLKLSYRRQQLPGARVLPLRRP